MNRFCRDGLRWLISAGQKLEGLDAASLSIKPPYANFLRKDVVTTVGFPNTLTIPENDDHLLFDRLHALPLEKFPLV